ncbi:hypothetical protein ACFWR9_14160 [Streptomyces sp. NPDC058534]|uniref:hypothetical protein n=1 Tax=Streptomyces sp. NPDC058534 TaxID=3346541 RepID=UPI00364C782B
MILAGHENTSDALVVAAAQVVGDRLPELYPHRVRTSRDGDPVHLQADSCDVVVDIGGVHRRRRDPAEDHVLIQCARPAPEGGDSFALDAYGFVGGLASADPALHDFLTGTDVDLYGAWAGLRGLPALPRGTTRRVHPHGPTHRPPHRRRGPPPPRPGHRAHPRPTDPLPRGRPGRRSLPATLPAERGRHPGPRQLPLPARPGGPRGERTVRILTLRSADAR